MREIKREKTRKDNLNYVLKDEGLKNLYVASIAGIDNGNYGKVGRMATQQYNYMSALTSGTAGMGKIQGELNARKAAEAMKAGRDPYHIGGYAPMELLEYAVPFYQGSWQSIYVSDAIKLLGVEGVHEKNISKEDMNLTMKEFEEKNGKMHQLLTKSYFGGLTQEGVGKALIASQANQKKSLEQILKSDPDKKEE